MTLFLAQWFPYKEIYFKYSRCTCNAHKICTSQMSLTCPLLPVLTPSFFFLFPQSIDSDESTVSMKLEVLGDVRFTYTLLSCLTLNVEYYLRL